ncbi:MAG: YqgE/AlgH family protein [Polynucleobacter victoriensis]
MTHATGSGYHLATQFLIAMPGMVDDNFAGSVVYVCDHSEQGAMGLVINRPTDVNLHTVLERLDLEVGQIPYSDVPVCFGGPVHTDRGFILHAPHASDDYSSSLKIPEGLCMTTSKDILESLVLGHGPERFLMTLGYAGWSAGQLEDEIAANGWLNVPATFPETVDIIFNTPHEKKYDKALALLGIEPQFLSLDAGHA